MKKNIREFDLISLVENFKQPQYRAKQLYRWLWKKSVNDINLISDIPDEFKNVLKANFY